MLILGIESSCDETAVAIAKDKKEVLSSVVASQIDVHKEFGGVSANSRLCERIKEFEEKYPNITFIVPSMSCCTNNVAMIAVAAMIVYNAERRADASLTADSSWEIQ